MKEVKLLSFSGLGHKEGYWPGNIKAGDKAREKAEQSLAVWLNAGWQIEGTGGSAIPNGFVVLVRDV